MDILANLLLILFYLSALYAALGLIGVAIAAIGRRLVTWHPRRPAPSLRRPVRRTRARRRIERAGAGAPRRPATAAQALRAL